MKLSCIMPCNCRPVAACTHRSCEQRKRTSPVHLDMFDPARHTACGDSIPRKKPLLAASVETQLRVVNAVGHELVDWSHVTTDKVSAGVTRYAVGTMEASHDATASSKGRESNLMPSDELLELAACEVLTILQVRLCRTWGCASIDGPF